MLNIKGIDMVTGFLDCYENDIINQNSIFKDYVFIEQKFDMPEYGIVMYNMVSGNVGIQVTVDNDSNKVITQRTWYHSANSETIYRNITKDGNYNDEGMSVLVERLQKYVLISLEDGDGGLHLKADVW